MSLWSCETHGLTGPEACCANAWRPGTEQGGAELRPEVLAFAQSMERKLRRHDAKRGTSWKASDIDALMQHLEDEVSELRGAIEAGCGVADEAADVGNLAMMVADRRGSLPEPAATLPGSSGARDEELPLSGATNEQIHAAQTALHFAGVHLSKVVLVAALDDAMRAIPLYRHGGAGSSGEGAA